MANSTMHGVSRATGTRYDVSRHASEGGRASGISRRLRPQRLLEEKIVESRNGAAHAKLLDMKRKDEAQLLAERYRLDHTVCELLDMKDDVEREIAQERERRDALRAEVDELERRKAQLDSDDAVVSILREIGEQRATIAAEQLGWGYDDEHGGDVVA
jgi:hypothetical protein